MAQAGTLYERPQPVQTCGISLHMLRYGLKAGSRRGARSRSGWCCSKGTRAACPVSVLQEAPVPLAVIGSPCYRAGRFKIYMPASCRVCTRVHLGRNEAHLNRHSTVAHPSGHHGFEYDLMPSVMGTSTFLACCYLLVCM
jgi:hypothetical protein